MDAASFVNGQCVGGGVLWRQGVDEDSGAGIKTRDGHAFVLKGYGSLYLITGVVRATLRPARPPRGHQNNNTRGKQCRHGVRRNVSRRRQRPLSEVEKKHWHLNRVKCPTRRTTRERKANAPTVAEMSRKMEPVRPPREARARRLRPETSAQVVREEADTDGEVQWCCLTACLPAWSSLVCSVRLLLACTATLQMARCLPRVFPHCFKRLY